MAVMISYDMVVVEVFQDISMRSYAKLATKQPEGSGCNIHFCNYLLSIPLTHALKVKLLAREYLLRLRVTIAGKSKVALHLPNRPIFV
jgi:hypothetical protein